MSNLNQAAEDLFFKLRNRFPKINLGDENGKTTVDPEKGRFFNFTYTDKDSKREYGDISCSLIDGSSLKVFFDTAITERMLPEDKNYWYQFLRELRRMAKSHMLNFDVRDITKDTLSRRDYEYMIKLNPEKKKMKESLEESRVVWQRRGKISEGDLNNVRIHVVHNEKMLENPNNRLLKVDRIYCVNEAGEKFLLPFKSVSGAKAMANHISRGGNPYDSNGQVISRAVSEMRNLGRFASATRSRTFEAAEAGNVIKAAQEMKESIKRHLNRLSNNSRSFAESLTALNDFLSEQSDDVTEVKGWFTQQTYNENLDNYIASAAGAYKKLRENAMNKLDEVSGAVEKKILDPNFKLVLKADSGLDKLMVTRQYTDTTALLTAVLGDIANRLIAKDGDDVANFAALMGDLVSSEGEAFGQRSEPEYNRDKKLAIVLAQKYMKDLGEIRKNPEYADEVRKEPNARPSDLRKTKSAGDEFEESIMGLGESPMSQPVQINGKQVDVDSLEVVIPDTSDYPDFSDAYFSAGLYTDGTPIDDQTLEDLGRTHGDLLHMTAHDQVQGMYDESAVSEEEVEESGLQYYTGKKKYGKDGMAALAKAGREGASQEELGKIKDKYMKEEDIDEADMTRRGFLGALGAGLGAAALGSIAGSSNAKADNAIDPKGPDRKKELVQLIKTGKIASYDDYVNWAFSKAVEDAPILKKGVKDATDQEIKNTVIHFVTSSLNLPNYSKISNQLAHSGTTTFDWSNPPTQIRQVIQSYLTNMKANESAVNEEPNEGNEFSGALAAAKSSGKKEFKVDGKTYPVKEGDASEPEHPDADADDKRWDDQEDVKENKPKGTPMKNKNIEEMRKLAGLPLMENYIYAQEESEDEENAPDTVPHSANEPSADDKAEYDQEGRMAKSDLKTAKDAADELRSILDDEENLPEWVQAKITKAVDYLDTARDYMKDNDVEYTDETVEEAKKKGKPDYLDFDKDGDKKETMKKALSDKKKMKESADLTWLQAVAGIVRK